MQVLQEIYNAADPDDPYIGFYIFHKPILLLRDPNIMKQIMIKDFDIFPNRRFGEAHEKDSVGLINLLGVKQPRWKYIRSKITPALTGQKLKSMIPLMIDRWYPMFKYIDSTLEEKDGWKSLELKNLASRYTTDVISSVAFGITTNSFDKNDTAFWDAGQKILSGTKRGILLIILFFLPSLGKIIEPLTTGPAHFFRHIFWQSVNVREQHGNKRGDLIDSLIMLKNGEQNPDYKFEGDNLLAQAVAFYVAGFEATSTAITFALFELARHKEHQSRLYQEIKSTLVNKELTSETINDMHFLNHVVDEALRMYPPLPMIDRIALQDYKIPETDLVIEKNVPVYISINGTNNDPRNYDNPEEFHPLRQKKESALQENLAFGIGPRSCIGQRMGQLMTKLAIIGIISNYELSFRHLMEGFNPTTVFASIANGAHVHMKKRNEEKL